MQYQLCDLYNALHYYMLDIQIKRHKFNLVHKIETNNLIVL